MAGVGPTTLFKYYQTKENPIVAISVAARSREWALAAEQCGIEKLLHFTAYEMIRYYTDWIICLYLSRPELLRFADRTEPSDYLMSKSDVSWGQDTARPFMTSLWTVGVQVRIAEAPRSVKECALRPI